MRRSISCIVLAAALSFICNHGECLEVQRVTTPGGLTAWLAEDTSTSVVSIRFAFLVGSADDPADKSGLATVLAIVMSDGGRGTLAKETKQHLVRRQARLAFEAGRDSIQGRIDTVANSVDDVAAVAADAITSDDVDPEIFATGVRKAMRQAGRWSREPSALAEEAWIAAAFSSHGYARPPYGNVEALAALRPHDLAEFARRNFTRSNLKVVAAGHINATALRKVLDRMFGTLPQGVADDRHQQLAVRRPDSAPILSLPTPEVVVRFGAGIPARTNGDFMATIVMNEILGGSPFGSRLTAALRDKAGLTYSVSSRVLTDRFTSVLTGEASVGPEASEQAKSIIRQEVERLATAGVDAKELADAKARLIGSYGFGFDSTKRIADNLIALQLDGLAPNHVLERNARIAAVTADDVKASAGRLFEAGHLFFVVAGGVSAPPTDAEPR